MQEYNWHETIEKIPITRNTAKIHLAGNNTKINNSQVYNNKKSQGTMQKCN